MAGPVLSGKYESWRYYDVINSGVNPIAPYQCISPLTAAQIASNTGSVEGEACRPAAAFVSGTSIITDRILGISAGGAKAGQQLTVQRDGVAHVMVGAAVAYGSTLFCGLAEQRTNSQTPLINLFEANLPVEPGVGITYNLSMADDVAISPQSGSANQLQLPIGYAIEGTGTAKYQLVRVEMETAPFYA